MKCVGNNVISLFHVAQNFKRSWYHRFITPRKIKAYRYKFLVIFTGKRFYSGYFFLVFYSIRVSLYYYIIFQVR